MPSLCARPIMRWRVALAPRDVVRDLAASADRRSRARRQRRDQAALRRRRRSRRGAAAARRRCATATCRRVGERARAARRRTTRPIDLRRPAPPSRRCPTDLDDVVVNNRLRRELDSAIAALRALVARSRARGWPPRRSCRAAPTTTCCRRSSAALAKETDPEIKRVADADAGVDPAREQRQGDAARRDPRARRKPRSRAPRRCCWRCSRRRATQFVEPDARRARRSASSRCASVERRLAHRRHASAASSRGIIARQRSCCSQRSASRSPTA